MRQTLVEHLQQRRADNSEARRPNGYLVGRDRIALWNEPLAAVVRRDDAMRRLDRALTADPIIRAPHVRGDVHA